MNTASSKNNEGPLAEVARTIGSTLGTMAAMVNSSVSAARPRKARRLKRRVVTKARGLKRRVVAKAKAKARKLGVRSKSGNRKKSRKSRK